MKKKIVEYIKQLEKSYEYNEKLRYHSMSDYYRGKADSIRATINDLNDILNGITYEERLDKILSK